MRTPLLIVASAVICMVIGCTPSRNGSSPTVAADTITNGLILAGGYVLNPQQQWTRADLLLVAEQHAFRIKAMAEDLPYRSRDSIDATNLYISNVWHPTTTLAPGRNDWLIVRTGPTLGHAVRFTIGRHDRAELRKVEPHENYPSDAGDDRVGCYSILLGEWDNPAYGVPASRGMVPRTLRLHWQFWFYPGRENYLIATDENGNLPSDRVSVPIWTLRGDSIRITFGHGFGGVTFQLGRTAEGLAGTMHATGDTSPGPTATMPVRLNRASCPPLEGDI